MQNTSSDASTYYIFSILIPSTLPQTQIEVNTIQEVTFYCSFPNPKVLSNYISIIRVC